MISSRAAALLALRKGPGYARQLVDRIRQASCGSVRLALGSLYPALHQLEKGQLLRSWSVVPGRRRGGRARRYYELTERGVRASEAASRLLVALVDFDDGRQADPPGEIARRKRRLELGVELSETGLLLSQRRRRKGAA